VPSVISINSNLAAMTARRSLGGPNAAFSQAVQRLSSGLRLNGAKDDAAGDFLATKLRAQVGGMRQAARNAQDGVSYLQTAEGGLSQMSEMVARMRELAVQAANGVYTAEERDMLQSEVDVLAAEITRIGQTTAFNGRHPLDSSNPDATPVQDMVEGLRRSWLPSAERLIERHYGITADGEKITIFLDQPGTAGGATAFVSGGAGADGKTTTMQLHVDYADISNFALPGGGTGPNAADRVIAHEMVHAVMGRAMNFAALPTWFKEGTAEYIHGADERLNADTAGQTTTNAVVNNAVDWATAWDSSSAHYSAAYAAVKYLDTKLTQAGQSMKTFFDTLQSLPNDLDDAIAATGLWADAATFVTDFKTNGTAFINTLNLSDADTGGIGGGDSNMTVPNMNLDTTDPLQHFTEVWPATTPTTGFFLHVGASSNSTDRLSLSSTVVTADVLGVSGLDLVNDAGDAIDRLDLAVESLASQRAAIGAAMNRIDYSIRVLDVQTETFSAAAGRIRDADVAQETASLVRAQLLQSTGLATLSQASRAPNVILSLLR
jgi:flagellin